MADFEIVKHPIFDRTDFFVRTAWRDNGRVLEITPVLSLDLPCGATLIASFQIDSMEMIDSCRFSAEKGRSVIPFRQTVRIINPNKWHPRSNGSAFLYEFKVLFYEEGRAKHALTMKTGIRSSSIAYASRDGRLVVNGKKTPCRHVELDFSQGETRLEELLAGQGGNFTVVKASHEDAQKRLSLCDRLGIVVALELDELESDFEKFRHHPSVCLCTANDELNSFAKRRDLELPFLFRSELALL